MENLASLQNVKEWCGVTTPNDDNLLNRLISNASRFILSYLQRKTMLYTTNSELLDGYGTQRIYPQPYPILSLTSLTISGQTIPILSPTDTTGYGAILETWNGIPPGSPQAISLRGYRFWKGLNNISLQYTSGYTVQNEATIVSASPYNTIQPYGNWAVDNGVTYASNGTALTPVVGDATPAQGQYAVSGGKYTFATADIGQGVLINYSYIPSDIEQACIELVGERYRYKGRIGEVSKSLGGQQTAAYSQKNMSDFVKSLLQPYNSTIL